MKKYFLIAKNTWDEMLTYRLNFTMWRVRLMLHTLALYFLWLSLLGPNGTLFGYTQSLILTYTLGISFVSAFVISSRSHAVGDEINQGTLSNYLIRPISYFSYWFAKDIGDKAMNVIFSVGEFVLLFLLLRPPLFIQTDLMYLSAFFVSLCIAIILYFLFNLLLGFIGFWSPEVWAPRFIFFITVSFFAGGYFPLDILPDWIFAFFQLLPFSYLLYFPLKIYLGQLSSVSIASGLLTSIAWALLLYWIARFVWKKGLQTYTAQGR